MDEATLKKWQSLHHRAALGEPLSPEEQTFYQKELACMQAEETYPGQIERMKALREQIAAAETEQILLRQQSFALKQHAAELETKLNARTRELLGIGA